MPEIPSLSFLHHRIKLRQLELVIELAEHGSLMRAAEAMHLTQPAASKMLHELESSLAVVLFDRLPRGVQPTVYGAAVIRYARQMFSDMQGLRKQLVMLESGELGQIRIGSIMAPALGFLPRVIVRMKDLHPNISLTLQIDTSDILVRALQLDKLDVVLGRIPLGWDEEGLSFEVLSEEPLSLVVGIDHPLGRKKRISWEDTTRYPWVLQPRPSPMRAIVDGALKGCHRQIAGVIETSSILMTASLLQEGNYVAVLPSLLARYYEEKNLLCMLPVSFAEHLRPFGIVRRDSQLIAPSTQLFIDHIKSNLPMRT